MKKCYIAGKISNLPKQEYQANFETAKQQVIELGFLAISPIELPHIHDDEWLSYMREDLQALLDCSHVFAMANWQDSKGAVIEIELALKLGLPVIYQDPTTAAKSVIEKIISAK